MVRRRLGATVSLSVWLTPTSVASLAVAACSSGLPHPPYAPQPTSALVEVAFPPPPARAEAVPPRPSRPDGVQGDVVWLDGEWTWRGRRWSWTPGRWVVAPPDARFSPWTTVMREDGATFFAPGVWRDPQGAPLAEAPEALAYARASSGVIFEPTGELQRTGPTIDPTRQRRRRDAGASPGASGAGARTGATTDADADADGGA